MSEERLAECPLLDGDRFAAISAVLDQVTHDMNNLLLPIVAYPALVRRDLAPGVRAHGMMDAIEQAGQAMLHITRQLMAMRADGSGQTDQIDLNDIAETVVGDLRCEDAQGSSTVALERSSAAVRIKGSLERTRKAVEALVRNAVEALPASGGSVQVTVSEASLQAGRFGSVPTRSGGFGAVRVTDNGEGFTEDAGRRLFDPFYTTRRTRSRRGAGLGLSIAYRVAADQGGWLTYRGDPGKGAVFTLYLPLA
jgi:signal transduction histidine kinase